MKLHNTQINSNSVGIGLTAYNRPYHLSKTLEGLKSNKVSYHTDSSHDFFIESTSVTDGIQKLKIDSSGVEIFDSVSAGYNKDSTSYFGKVAVGNAGIRGSASFSHISKNNENDYHSYQL